MREKPQKFRVLGIMSGTSLDGIDLALCEFEKTQNSWEFQIISAETYSYTTNWILRLSQAQHLSAIDFMRLHKHYGTLLGETVNRFLVGKPIPDFISSHGHTIFHLPHEKMTVQIGDGAYISAETDIPCISDFRNLDVALGGQGAPLVPVGDKYLFPFHTFCLNIGGFANISFDDSRGNRTAFDICPANFVLNLLAQELGKQYDENGDIARNGNINRNLLEQLDNIEFYKQSPPKSLGREFVEIYILTILNEYLIPTKDKLRTFIEHIANQIFISTKSIPTGTMLITGGGAHNSFLYQRIKDKIQHQVEKPTDQLVDFKEALVFAFLGVLRHIAEPNCLASVTGAKKNNIGGVYNLV